MEAIKTMQVKLGGTD